MVVGAFLGFKGQPWTLFEVPVCGCLGLGFRVLGLRMLGCVYISSGLVSLTSIIGHYPYIKFHVHGIVAFSWIKQEFKPSSPKS